MFKFGGRKFDNYVGEYRFTLPLPFAPPMASQAKKATFLSETASHTFAHRIVQKPPTEFKHLQLGGQHFALAPDLWAFIAATSACLSQNALLLYLAGEAFERQLQGLPWSWSDRSHRLLPPDAMVAAAILVKVGAIDRAIRARLKGHLG